MLLRNHLRPGGVGMRSFWSRRIRRLLPAAFLALAGIILFAATVGVRQQVEALPGDVIGAATWSANWRFVLSGKSYIDLFSAPSPVQHFWSLAVEEQFYLLFPIGLLLLVRKTRSPKVIGGILAAAALLSTGWMVTLYYGGAGLDRLYYGTDTRVAELLVGAVLAVIIMQTGTDFSERTRRIMATVGAIAFAASIWCWVNIPLADGAIWKGGFLVYSLVSVAVILGVLAGRGPLVRLLCIPPLPFIGRISYGLYLYHWPIFLWLTAERTGLTGWSLLALRVGVTFAVAISSYYFVERPILHGASFKMQGAARLAIIPLVISLLIGATLFVANNRSAEDPLATLRAGASSVAMPASGSDSVFNLLVIPATANDPVITQLQRQADPETVKITVAPPFQCTGGLVATPKGQTCASWAESWPKLIARDDPDAVLVYVNNWAGEPIAQLAGTPVGSNESAARILAPAFDLLTARGAPIVWATSSATFEEALRDSLRPFNQAMATLEAQRSDIYRVVGGRLPDPAKVSRSEYLTQSASVLLADTSLYQRRQAVDLPHVMIVGDSQSLSLGYGLNQWAKQHDRAVVWNRGIEGCGVAVDGEIHSFGSSDSGLARCREVEKAWPAQVQKFQPDLAIVLSSFTDVQDRRLPGSSSYSSIGQPAFDNFLVSQYERVVDRLSAGGAKVLWMTAPCADEHGGATPVGGYEVSQIEHLNSVILPRLLRSRPGKVTTFDLAGVLCPHGTPRTSAAGTSLRPDGVHFSIDGSLWFANRYADKVLKAGGL